MSKITIEIDATNNVAEPIVTFSIDGKKVGILMDLTLLARQDTTLLSIEWAPTKGSLEAAKALSHLPFVESKLRLIGDEDAELLREFIADCEEAVFPKQAFQEQANEERVQSIAEDVDPMESG